METQPKSGFLLELREKHIARAWIAACVSAGITVIFGLLALVGEQVLPGFDAWILLDATVLGGLAFGVAKRSRVCAVILVIYGIANLVAATLEGRLSLLGFVFIYFYIRGAIEIFRYHRHSHQMPQATDT